MIPGKELVFCALGGSGEIGMNVNLYGCQGKWLMVDLGMTFGMNEYPGIDLVFADLEFIENERENLLGIVLTHAHEDHIGAVPYFAEDLDVPIYATPFTARLVAAKLEEAGILDEVELIVVEDLEQFQIGPFGVRYVPLAHSIAEGNALVIETPYGRIFHTGDWKLDDAPQIGTPATAEELTAIGDEGVLALVCDSTNVFNDKASGSEGEVYEGLLAEVQRHKGKRVLVTTFASNVARLQTLGDVARKTGRRLCVAGRSLDRIIRTGQACGYLRNLPEPIDVEEAMDLPRDEVLIVATGGQGEPRAALARISEGSHPIKLEKGDVVLFSSRQIPGNEISIGRIQNRLADAGVEIVTDRQSMIHVSGHPGRPELEALYGWIRPQILMPVHGEIRHMKEQVRLGLSCGIPRAVFQKNGDLVRLAPDHPGKFGEVRAGRLVLDGDIIAPSDGEAMVMRRRIAYNGVVSVAADRKGHVQVAAMGLPLDEDYADFVEEARRDVAAALGKAKKADHEVRVEAARLAARRAATRWSGKKPQVQVLLLED
ncbi:ribonuclease J [Novosphingobium mangrovi (ex Huang et al. 2023)]|uniref:Ribonuclease J n=1 Tax=Novosphingobium mangrovi (ex Huang et al. 2023) TaxID=2976432 RepID=A0ABT2I3W8_9SPHN|nr:ribonuclease J [Novosphingobium mangrovi (ex Huang et al. 2023)]MCT2399506.1 ribonuclease J [Novosphingobium mangrovi (ex Huang et al. 2023)]